MARTAQENDGRCVPCARGTRAQFERNRQWYADHKRYQEGPEWQFWLKLVKVDFREMTPAAQQYYAVNCVRGEVFNGGFDQYFHNSSGDHYLTAMRGLLAMGAGRSLDIVRRAKEVLFENEPVLDEAARWLVMRRKENPETQMALNELDKAFCEDPDDLVSLMRTFARIHALFPEDPA